jgi:hypothetical protein
MSDFHPETWNPMWSVATILTGLYSFMMDSNPTLGSIETTTQKKRQLAAESLAYNVKNSKEFCKLFPEYVELYQREVEEQKLRNPAPGSGGGPDPSSALSFPRHHRDGGDDNDRRLAFHLRWGRGGVGVAMVVVMSLAAVVTFLLLRVLPAPWRF